MARESSVSVDMNLAAGWRWSESRAQDPGWHTPWLRPGDWGLGDGEFRQDACLPWLTSLGRGHQAWQRSGSNMLMLSL